MEEEKIDEGNRLIAEFMGYQILSKEFQYRIFISSNESYYESGKGNIVCDKNGREVNLYPDEDPLFKLEDLPFDSSWDWLMPVVEKIESKGFDFFINGRYGRITDSGMTDFEIESGEASNKISAVWEVCVEFIKWYNK